MPKRKFKATHNSIPHTSNNIRDYVNKSSFVAQDFESNPSCPHGPKVCFEKGGQKFFSCSAFRSPKECQHNSEKILNKVSNSGVAQYLFSQESADFLTEMLLSLGLENFICMGAPSIHGKLLERNVNSYLLDLDPDMVRAKHFNGLTCAKLVFGGHWEEIMRISKYPSTSCQYNMCNHYFFYGNNVYRDYLNKLKGSLTVVMDPPFSAKPEILAYVHTLVQKDWQDAHSSPDLMLNCFWIAPYFLEGHIKKANSKLYMSDYQINYDNHGSFSKGSKRSRKHGSPIRFFTNVPLSQIQLPITDYKFCSQCDKFVSNSNQHCNKCGDCTSKDGQTYKHCTKCSKCVKPTWTHCTQCSKCALSAEHVC